MERKGTAWMRRCFDAAGRGLGKVSPNPMVGAVLVKGGRVLAQAHHSRYGGPHAEAAVLKRAGRAARGATLYVSLEPCAHEGKTPPCTRGLIRAGVRRVVAAMRDPHPLVNGRGFRELRRAGIEVSVGLLGREARALNLAYLTALQKGRPMVTLKAGISLDGRIATSGGASRWITSPASRLDAHRLRAEHDAVLVGIGTALADRPRLDARLPGRGIRQPYRVVLDSRLRLDPSAPLLRSRGGGPVLVYARGPGGRKAADLERSGASVIAAGPGSGGVSLHRVLEDLARRGVHSLLVEGGASVSWSFLRAGLADRIVFYVAPVLLGGTRAVPAIGGEGFPRLEQAARIQGLEARASGPDLRISGRIAPRRTPGRGSRAVLRGSRR